MFCFSAQADWNPGTDLNRWLSPYKLKLSFENRQRYEDREHPAFARERDIAADFIRTRVGLAWTPAPWIKLSGMAQDTRAPLYGSRAAGTVRDPVDLQEAYVELFPEGRGFGLSAGRRMISYGDSRLIGAPQWAYTARTWDHARVYYRTGRARFEVLFVSPIKPRGDGFNKPILGDRIWGTYNVFNLPGNVIVEPYILRHTQNRPGGFAGPGRFETNTFGARAVIPITAAWRWTLEGGLQNGKAGDRPHRAGAYVVNLGRKLTLANRSLDVSGEYKYASGSSDPDESGTFDQMYPAAHDKLGHLDLIAWQNVHNIKALASWALSKPWLLHIMYDNTWLASRTDALYGVNSRPVLRAPAGDAGRHVGNELDVFTTYRYRNITLGGGGGRFWAGTFVRNLSPNAKPWFGYVFYDYAF